MVIPYMPMLINPEKWKGYDCSYIFSEYFEKFHVLY